MDERVEKEQERDLGIPNPHLIRERERVDLLPIIHTFPRLVRCRKAETSRFKKNERGKFRAV